MPSCADTKPRRIHAFIDVPRQDWAEARSYWAAATGSTLSSARGEDGQFCTLEPPAGSAWVKLQAIDGPARVHLDFDHPDREGTVAKAVSLGAERAWTYDDVQVMHSPGGLLFCCTVGDGTDGRFVRTADAVLDQVCIDIPERAWEVETAFWAALTGRELTTGSVPEFARLLDPTGGPRILLQRLGEPSGVVRAHPDFAVADRDAETSRHRELGAQVIGEFSFWTVLRAPGGHVYCLTDRDPATGSLPPSI